MSKQKSLFRVMLWLVMSGMGLTHSIFCQPTNKRSKTGTSTRVVTRKKAPSRAVSQKKRTSVGTNKPNGVVPKKGRPEVAKKRVSSPKKKVVSKNKRQPSFGIALAEAARRRVRKAPPAGKRTAKKSVPSDRIRPAKAHESWKKLQKEKLFSWPLDRSSFWISSLYGPRKKLNGTWGFHAGVDMAASTGTPVFAAGSGRVVKATHSPGYGNYVLVEHDSKWKTRYAHLDKILVRAGQNVQEGCILGKVGATGLVRKSRKGSSGSHLHFEIHMHGKPVNPFYFLA